MKPTISALTAEFTRLVGPEAFAKAEAAIVAAKIAAEAAAKVASEKAAAAAAAAKAAADKASADKVAAAVATGDVGGVPSPRAASLPLVVPPVAPRSENGVGRAGTPLPAKPGAEGTPRPTPNPAPRPPAPAALPLPTLPVHATLHALKGYDLDALVAPDQVVDAARILDAQGFAIDTITGIDWMAQDEMEVVYDYFHLTESLRVVIRTRVARATPEVPSIAPIFPGANWHERETHDFFGIRFSGHPNLKPFLLPENADFHPLRKDYQP